FCSSCFWIFKPLLTRAGGIQTAPAARVHRANAREKGYDGNGRRKRGRTGRRRTNRGRLIWSPPFELRWTLRRPPTASPAASATSRAASTAPSANRATTARKSASSSTGRRVGTTRRASRWPPTSKTASSTNLCRRS
ncbi:hypothetical protein M885DRAFT_478179, partial [Pelagophyceae sp. CCMP2097]